LNILTFDIEEWFHILDNDSTKTEYDWAKYEYRLEKNVDRILSLLLERNQKATFFILGWIAREFPKVVKEISDYGFEVATHSDMHQLVYNQSRADFREDLKKSISSIESLTGKKVVSYRAPGFSLKPNSEWVFEELNTHGIEIDCSIFPAKRAHGGYENFGTAQPTKINFNGIQIKEFPINVFNIINKSIVFSGGGYFRLLPYSLIKHMTRSSKYVMTYFHPRDFDYTQPIIKGLSSVRRFKSYYGLKTAFKKLQLLLDDFYFTDLIEANKSIDWTIANKINLSN